MIMLHLFLKGNVNQLLVLLIRLDYRSALPKISTIVKQDESKSKRKLSNICENESVKTNHLNNFYPF